MNTAYPRWMWQPFDWWRYQTVLFRAWSEYPQAISDVLRAVFCEWMRDFREKGLSAHCPLEHWLLQDYHTMCRNKTWSLRNSSAKKRQIDGPAMLVLNKIFENLLAVIYQAGDAVFHPQMKHWVEGWKYDAQQSIFDELWGVSSSKETLRWMLDTASQRWRNLVCKNEQFFMISKRSLNINFVCIFLWIINESEKSMWKQNNSKTFTGWKIAKQLPELWRKTSIFQIYA